MRGMGRKRGTNWGEIAIGSGIIFIGLIDLLPDEPATIPLGLSLIADGLGWL